MGLKATDFRAETRKNPSWKMSKMKREQVLCAETEHFEDKKIKSALKFHCSLQTESKNGQSVVPEGLWKGLTREPAGLAQTMRVTGG